MNIYTHPEQIKAISSKLTAKHLFAYNSSFNYYLLDGNYYSIFHEGCGSYPELISINEIKSNSKSVQ